MKSFVRIVVSEPTDWKGGNLFGEIVSERDDSKLKVRLSQTLKGCKFSSNTLILTPRFEKETFKSLQQHYAVKINGSIINEQTNEQEHLISGIVTYD
ncbi:hypothetical protein ACXZ1K_15880 [Pedobacter sp. PWIIR3]